MGISEAFQTDSTAGIAAFAAGWISTNAATGSKYVDHVAVSNTGNIDVFIAANAGNGIPVLLNGKTIGLAPNVNLAAPAANATGAIDWACGTSTTKTATGRGFANINAGTLDAKYAPTECR